VLCHSVWLSVCLSVCLSVHVHSHGRISWSIFAKNGIEVTSPEVRTSSLGFNIAPLFPYFVPQNRHFRPKGLKIHADMNNANFCLKYSRIAGIPACYKKSGSRNTTVTSDLRQEVEMSQVRACALKIWSITVICGTVVEIPAKFMPICHFTSMNSSLVCCFSRPTVVTWTLKWHCRS